MSRTPNRKAKELETPFNFRCIGVTFEHEVGGPHTDTEAALLPLLAEREVFVRAGDCVHVKIRVKAKRRSP